MPIGRATPQLRPAVHCHAARLAPLMPVGLVAASAAVGPLLPSAAQATSAVALMLLVGLPHGATDRLSLVRARQPGQRATQQLACFYALTWSAACACLEHFPALGLAIFLLLSAHHWGQSHGANGGSYSLRRSFLGAVIIAILTLTHGAESARFLQLLDAYNTDCMLEGLQVYGCVGVLGFFSSSYFTYWEARRVPGMSRWDWRSMLKEILLLIAVLALCLKSGLAFSFASYFSLGHASEGWRQQLSSSKEPSQWLKCYAEGLGWTFLAVAVAAVVATAVWLGKISAARAACMLVSASVPHMLLHDWVVPRLYASTRLEAAEDVHYVQDVICHQHHHAQQFVPVPTKGPLKHALLADVVLE